MSHSLTWHQVTPRAAAQRDVKLVLEGDHSRGLRPSHEPNVAIATHHVCRTRRGPCGAVASPRHFSSSLGGPGGEGSRDLGSGPAAAVLPPCFWHVPP